MIRLRARDALATWRRMGLRRGGAAAARSAVRLVAASVRARRLRRRPPAVSDAELAAALGGSLDVAALRSRVLAAMPPVSAFERDLEARRDDLVARADALLAHRFDLLGSGPVVLDERIDWHTDFKTGRRWPLEHVSRLPVSYPDGSDVKVPWELSRFQHLPVLAAVHRLTGERRYLDEVGAQIGDWIASNPVEFGVNWLSTMDVAIRAANWVAALGMCAEAAAGEPWLRQALASVLLHGRFIHTHLEGGPVRGNHYLSNVAGLLAIAAVFRNGDEGARWADWASAELVAEMGHQVRPDGCDHEASTAYHRLVCEMFVCGAQAVDELRPGTLGAAFREQLDAMLGVVAGYTRPDGLAPQVGDNDDGRYLPLGDYGVADPRSHAHLFAQAGRAPAVAAGHAAFPDGGLFAMRGNGLYALVRCGDVGMDGTGPHAHNDQLAIEVAYREQPLIADPGSYVYTADPAARNLFRSTRFHATLRVGGAEQNELRSDTLFEMPDRTRAELIAWHAEGARARFEGRHHGYEALDPPALHTRVVDFDGDRLEIAITDTVDGAGTPELEWTFPLVPGAAVETGDGRAVAELPGARLAIEAEGLAFSVDDGWQSPAYGRREPAPFVRARRAKRSGADVTRITLRVSPPPPPPPRGAG